ncbi:hypothetical protein [Armatimonas sp.]|uniref:hypothetical protein n=1 Tax=Armatimonas sp. TaxID=1872638 RepID=UPI00286C049D|nr:hypothetical protein [Armatimonas sp.]
MLKHINFVSSLFLVALLCGCSGKTKTEKIEEKAVVHRKEIAEVKKMNISSEEKEKRIHLIEEQMARDISEIRHDR